MNDGRLFWHAARREARAESGFAHLGLVRARELSRARRAAARRRDVRSLAGCLRATMKQMRTEDTIRTVALPLGLVDIKVCVVDDVWSGLKLVIRKENR